MTKIKLKIPITQPEPDPPPFKCFLCGVERDNWLLLHDGKEKICSRHYAKPVLSYQEMRDFKYKDTMQIQAASLIIRELKNAKQH
jgi:hypothetical protein